MVGLYTLVQQPSPHLMIGDPPLVHALHSIFSDFYDVIENLAATLEKPFIDIFFFIPLFASWDFHTFAKYLIWKSSQLICTPAFSSIDYFPYSLFIWNCLRTLSIIYLFINIYEIWEMKIAIFVPNDYLSCTVELLSSIFFHCSLYNRMSRNILSCGCFDVFSIDFECFQCSLNVWKKEKKKNHVRKRI